MHHIICLHPLVCLCFLIARSRERWEFTRSCLCPQVSSMFGRWGASNFSLVLGCVPGPLKEGQAITEMEREVLVTFYTTTDGPNWRNNRNWLSDAPIVQWPGVIVDGDGRVIELFIQGGWLSGELPKELGNLSRLRVLDLYDNRLEGEIPAELGYLPELRALNLGHNRLSGDIPAEMAAFLNWNNLTWKATD